MKQHDLELLSSYLDGQLNPGESARLEARLLKEPELRSVLRDLRSARSVLRQLPMRKAPRSFRLTPQMVGKNPPLPRAYPAFRFTSALAALLLFLSFGLNLLRPQLAAAPPFGMGGGGGPAAAEAQTNDIPAATQAPAATEAPVEPPSILMAPLATATAPFPADTARALETAVSKNGETSNAAGTGLEQQSPPVPSPMPVVSSVWQWFLAGIALVSAFIMAMMRQLSINRWRKK